MAREADFDENTKQIIAMRAGYRCSFPGCNKITIGPGGESHEYENTGQAAHIFAASAGGPRGTGGLSVDQRKHAQNGTWLCYKHGKMIDSHKGARYPASQMQQWKAAT